VLTHINRVVTQYAQSVLYIEKMLYEQLVAAIGKVITPDHFAEYMEFHNNKLFSPEYRPQPCSYGVRSTDAHAPQGTVAIEISGSSEIPISRPVNTLVSHSIATAPMMVQLTASTEISFNGDRFLHGYLAHQFGSGFESNSSLHLVAKARQFSSFVVMLGKISGPDTFDPTYAMIVRNKDEFKVPLDLETIPTAKEFRDSISSLSAEQQDFCKAFRGMQLESTLFGVVVIQIKPQLEKLLNLAPDALAKEIQLTEHLMELFIKYQIPADLLSFEQPDVPISQKDPRRLQAVQQHVDKMYEMINSEKDKQLAEKLQQEAYRSSGRFGGFGAAIPSEMDCDFGGFGGAMIGGAATPRRAMSGACAEGMDGGESEAPAPQQQHESGGATAAASGTGVDYTKIPKQMDAKFEELDTDAALRPTIIKPGSSWLKTSQKGLLSTTAQTHLSADGQKSAKDEAFDLLDGITRAGALSCDHASLHVVIAATHCFEKNLMDSVVQNNINPIDKVERSMLIMANTIHNASVEQLVATDKYTSIAPELVEKLPALESNSVEQHPDPRAGRHVQTANPYLRANRTPSNPSNTQA